MKKSDIKIIPAYGLHYANQASDENLMDQLEHGGISLFEKNSEMLEKIGTRVYAQGKWSVPIIIEHLIDAERVFQYRALRFARQDKTPLSGFDEDIWVMNFSVVSKGHIESLNV